MENADRSFFVSLEYHVRNFINFEFRISNFEFQIPDSRFQIPDFRFPISDFRFPGSSKRRNNMDALTLWRKDLRASTTPGAYVSPAFDSTKPTRSEANRLTKKNRVALAILHPHQKLPPARQFAVSQSNPPIGLWI